MPRTVLVTEADSPMGVALTRLLLDRGCAVVGTRERDAPAPRKEEAVPGRHALSVAWNRRSPVSAHALLRTALNAFPTLDDALILEPPCGVEPQLARAPSAAIEKAFDDAQGPVFIAREILEHFQKASAGVLCFVSRGPAAGPVESGLRECFRGFASALLARTNGLIVNGFQQGEAGAEEYAAFIDRTLEEKARKISGRWFTCPSRGGIFTGIRAARK